MQLTQLAPQLIDQIIILDIAPITYQADSHAPVFQAMDRCLAQQLTDRKSIYTTMSQYIPDRTIQFLLKSYKSGRWLFNYQAINHHYADIRGWSEISPYLQPILFIRGGLSHYILDEYWSDILSQFPYASLATVDDAHHNVHSEQPQQVIVLIKEWLRE